MPMPMAAPMPEFGVSAAARIASACWNWAYFPRSPTMPMLVRLSSTASTSLGSEMFSTNSAGVSMP